MRVATLAFASALVATVALARSLATTGLVLPVSFAEARVTLRSSEVASVASLPRNDGERALSAPRNDVEGVVSAPRDDGKGFKVRKLTA